HVPAEEILLAALSRAIARTLGDADLAVDVSANRQSTVILACRSPRNADATEVLRAVHRVLAGAHHNVRQAAEVRFSYLGAVPTPISTDGVPPREVLPGSGHALEVRVYRVGDSIEMDWWYDTRQLDRSTADELTEQFPLALIDVTSDAVPPIRQPAHLAMA
ncbi:MAG: hypothetical protein JO191_06295, partial [Mycobacteriaceae bacterium]|nr:hypothetical protein [Mycobacteriaceae bacterium]